jgi:hypothetical protein
MVRLHRPAVQLAGMIIAALAVIWHILIEGR